MKKETIKKIEEIIEKEARHYNSVRRKYKKMNTKAGWNIASLEATATIQSMWAQIQETLLEEFEHKFKQ